MNKNQPNSNKITKIGVLLSDTQSNNYLYSTLKELSTHGNIELYYLLNNKPVDDTKEKSGGRIEYFKSLITEKGVAGALETFLLAFIVKCEKKLLAKNVEKYKDHHKTYDLSKLAGVNTLKINPFFSKSRLIVRYDEKDVEKIKSLELDFIIRGNAPGIFKGGILGAAKNGIISFHHGDNRWNRGGPPGFWEVYLKKPSTGFIIQILSESLDGGQVIFRGSFPTKRAFRENQINLYQESNPYMAKLLISYANGEKLPTPEKPIPYDGKLFKNPKFFQSFNYMARTGGYVLKQKWQDVLERNNRWGVAYCEGSWRNIELRRGTVIKNPKGHFFADPFVIKRQGRTICFLEDLDYSTGRGCISAVEILSKKEYKVLGPIIKEPFHMSFPFLLDHENELYMIPETNEARAIRLYKCVDFPMKWEYQHDLMSPIKAVDTMVFKSTDEKWWLITNTADESSDEMDSKLCAYYSSNPISDEWKEHENNPIVFDSEIARNGGLLFDQRVPYRVRQKHGGFRNYGAEFSIARIDKLTPTDYAETSLGNIKPNFFPDLKGCHTLNSNHEFTVFDYVKFENIKK